MAHEGGGGGGSAANQEGIVTGAYPVASSVGGGLRRSRPPAALLPRRRPAARRSPALPFRRRGTASRGRQAVTESYARVAENTFVRASQEPLATFSIDVDTASYSNVRRFLNHEPAPARRRGSDRGARQLLHLRLRAVRQAAIRLAPAWKSRMRRGIQRTASCASASKAREHRREAAADQQSGVPDRRVGIDEHAAEAAAGEERTEAARRSARRKRHGLDRRLRRQQRTRAADDERRAQGV